MTTSFKRISMTSYYPLEGAREPPLAISSQQAVAITTNMDKSDMDRIWEFCKDQHPQGVSDKILQGAFPDIENAVRAKAINDLLAAGKIDLYKSPDGNLLLKAKDQASKAGTIKGDQEEKVVYGIIEEAGNKGTWIRDIRLKSNLVQTQLNKVLKTLETKKLIKVVKCVNATKKKVYMLYHLEPDQSVTGGAWYSNQDFESEFVEVLNQQCFRYLQSKAEQASSMSKQGPIAVRRASTCSSKDVLNFISNLGISKISLKLNDIEMILDTLIFDGKVEREQDQRDNDGHCYYYYRAVESLIPASTGLVRVPCGICPVIRDCNPYSIGSISPLQCFYYNDWVMMDF